MSALLLAACGARQSAAPATAGLTLPAGFEAVVVARDLQGPTQIIRGPDNTIWVALLAGAENAGSGQVVALSLTTGERQIVLGNLRKPTGIAILDDALWIAAGRDLLRAPLDGAKAGPPEVVLQNLPFNGRSNGTLTTTPDGKLLFETSGSLDGTQATARSGTLWLLDPARPNAPSPLATGLKGAYAHTFDAAGRLWTTEIGDDTVDGDAPPEELNLVSAGANYGWPQCYGDRQPASNFGGTAAQCEETRAPTALFPIHATPTGIAAAPWDADTLLVALWNSAKGEIVQVQLSSIEGSVSGTVSPFLSGLQRPQHLLALDDGRVFISDFGSGVIYALSQTR